MFDRTEAAFEAAVVEGQSNGELARSADPKAIASLLLTTVVGMQVMVKSSPDTDRLHRVVDALLATI
jgi:TetR/AcrR family transcriptional repressor of nem operon